MLWKEPRRSNQWPPGCKAKFSNMFHLVESPILKNKKTQISEGLPSTPAQQNLPELTFFFLLDIFFRDL